VGLLPYGKISVNPRQSAEDLLLFFFFFLSHSLREIARHSQSEKKDDVEDSVFSFPPLSFSFFLFPPLFSY